MSADTWEHVVASALLGTDRRRLPGVHESEATTDLLRVAARHRATVRAGAQLPDCGPVEVPPGENWPDPPKAARVVLAHLMATRQYELINAWLEEANAHRVGLPADHWTDLVGLAARTTAIDRRLISEVLGVGGRWFVEQNPQWSGVARALRPADGSHEQSRRPGVTTEGDEALSDGELTARMAIAASFQASQQDPRRGSEDRNGK